MGIKSAIKILAGYFRNFRNFIYEELVNFQQVWETIWLECGSFAGVKEQKYCMAIEYR